MLKAVSNNYRVADLLRVGDFWAHTVADDGVSVVLVDRFQLGPGLQDQAGRDLTASDRCNQLLHRAEPYSMLCR